MIELGLVVARLLHYAAVTTLAGVSFFPLYAYAGTEPTALLRWRQGVFLAAAIAGLLSAILWFVFAVAIPALLFRLMSDFSRLPRVDPRLLIAYFGSCFVVFALGRLIAQRVFRMDGVSQSVFALGGIFANNVLLGVPLAKITLGEASIPVVSLVLVFNALTRHPSLMRYSAKPMPSAISDSGIAAWPMSSSVPSTTAGSGMAVSPQPVPTRILATTGLVRTAFAACK